MEIIEIKKDKGAAVSLNCDELNELNNILYHFIEYAEEMRKSSETTDIVLTSTICKLKFEIGLARDLSQYGQLDKFSTEQLVKYCDKATKLGVS